MMLFAKLLLEFLPLGLFFIISTEYDVYVGTAGLMIATLASTALIWVIYRQLAWMAIITASTGIISGAMTLLLVDPVYVKMKPTVVGGIFAAILMGGLLLDRPLFKWLLGENLHLTDRGWQVLTWLWFWYFLFIVILNEAVWRNYSFDFWVTFKAFGLMPLTVLYALPQIYLLRKYRLPDAGPLLPQSRRFETP